MSSSRTAILLGGLAVVGVGLAFTNRESAGQLPAVIEPVTAVGVAQKEDRPADRDAVRKAIDTFVAAFQKGDAKAVAAMWTPTGEYVGDDGATFRGRAALEKEYADLFAKNAGGSLQVEIDSIRFPSRDNAVVEGHFKLRTTKGGELIVSQCSFLYTREDGKWLIAIAREWPGDGLSLRDLEWLVGTWEAKRDGVTVRTHYEWTANKSFIRCHFSVTQDGETHTGMQIIGKMPSTGGLHMWTFEDNGGIGDSDITRDGKKWVIAARGSTADGRVITATNIMTPMGADSFTWQSVDRTRDGESLPDTPPIKVVRVKGKK